MNYSKEVLREKKTELEIKLVEVTSKLLKCSDDYEQVKQHKHEIENKIRNLEDDIKRMS